MLLFCALAAVASPTITAEGARLEMGSGAVIVAETARLSADGDGEATHVRASHVGQSLTIQAEHTRWDLGSRTSEFVGGVKATQGELSLSCDRATLQYADDETVQRAVAKGQVVVTRGGHRATGEMAVLEAGRLTLTGKPQLSDGRSVMKGTQIVFVIGEEAIECDDCTLTVPSGRPEER